MMFVLKKLNNLKRFAFSRWSKYDMIKLADVDGKCALVTNGTTGVGLAFAKELLREKAAKVVITGNDESDGTYAECFLNKYYGKNKANFIKTDIDVTNDFKNVFKHIKENYNGLDIFVNNSETNCQKNFLNSNLVNNIQAIILAQKNINENGVVINHVSAMELNVTKNTNIEFRAASFGSIAAFRAFGDDMYFNDDQVRIVTLCSEPFPPKAIAGTQGIGHTNKGTDNNCGNSHAIEFSIARSAAYLVQYGPRNTVWLCQQDGTLNTIEFQTLQDFSMKYEPELDNFDRKKRK